MNIKLGDQGPQVVDLQQKLVKRGYAPLLAAGGDPVGLFGPQTWEHVKEFQSSHKDVNGTPLVVDGQVGPKTMWSLNNESRVLNQGAILIRMKAVQFPFYADKKIHTFWLDEEVADSFVEGIKQWEANGGGQYIVTGAYRSVAAQAIAKKAKPALCCAPGWSMHGQGRAVDGHFVGENPEKLKLFYTHMQKFGWFTIFNFPASPVIYKAREEWHIQKTTPSGMRSHDYLEKWAEEHGGEDSLLRVQKLEVH